jgi:predicted RNA-binding Zn ribbon-like protein
MDESFAFVSGNGALDLVGTVGRRRTEPRDLLREPADLARWMLEAGLLPTAPEVAAGDLAAAARLREAVYGIASAIIGGGAAAAADLAVVNEFAARPALRLRLDGVGRMSREGDAGMALTELAREAVELFAGPAADRIRECAFEDCTRLYVDTSLRGSRRWCDMRRCGNRAKVADFRARRSAAQAGTRPEGTARRSAV